MSGPASPNLVRMSVEAGVAAAHPATAQAGADLLAQGGSATDAAVGMMLTSCAAETIFTGLGGGGFAIHYDAAERRATCVDFFVAVPGLGGRPLGTGVPIEVNLGGQPIPYEIGPATVAVPGVPAGAFHLWQRWGRLEWPDVVAPGLVAAHGTPLPYEHAALLPSITPAMCVGEGRQVYQRADGTVLQAGDTLCHPDHGASYELLAKDPEAFSNGPFATAMVAAVGDGGALGAEDVTAYRVRDSEPAEAPIGVHSVLARGNDLDDLLETMARAAAAVTQDPTSCPEAARALVRALRGPARRSETTNLVAVDTDGNACAITTSLGLGSGVWVPGFGVHLNSMLGEGELIRGRLEAGDRMGSMMSPLLVVDDERRLVLAAGAAGGSRIRSSLVQSVLRVLAGETPQEAINAPRLNALVDAVRLEPGFHDEVVAALRADGDQVHVAERRDPYFGGVSAIGRRGGGADPRRGGVVIPIVS